LRRLEWSVSNVLEVSLQTTIYNLSDRGWSQRRIGRELGINRETVGRYLLLRAKPAISTTGPEGSDESSKPANPTAGDDGCGELKPAISTAGKGAGRKSQCEPLAGVISSLVEVGLSAQRIFQDLVAEHGFTDSYESVKRFVRKLREKQPVSRQDTETFLRCLENAVRSFGGVPLVLNVDYVARHIIEVLFPVCICAVRNGST